MYDRHKLAAERPVLPRQHGDGFESETRNQPQTFSFVCRASEQLGQPIGEQLRILLESVGRLNDGLAEIRDLLSQRPRSKEWYSTQELAELLGKQRSSSTWIAEAEPKITIAVADTPDECLVQARGLSESHDFVVADGAAGIDDLSRTLLILSDLALLPISPSILDLRSVQQATSILRFAQQINHGKPEGRLLLNKMRTRETISRELRTAAAGLGIAVAETVIRDLQAYRDAAQQATTVTRMTRRADQAASEVHRLFDELLHKTIAATAKRYRPGSSIRFAKPLRFDERPTSSCSPGKGSEP